MKSPLTLCCSLCATAIVLQGCVFVPVTKFNVAETENRALAEQNRVQLMEIDNLRRHNREVEDRVIRAEKQLALAEEKANLDAQQLAVYRDEREELYRQVRDGSCATNHIPAELSRQLADLSRRYPNLQFDAETGVSKLDTDVLFDSGQAELKPGAGRMLDELVGVLKSPAAGDMRIMVAGHTDNQMIAGGDTRERYPNNFHLSTARALAVADRMKRAGMPPSRLGVAGFGACQPIASNATAQDRQKNRRVEIFVLSPNVPVVGWSESMPSVYGAGLRR